MHWPHDVLLLLCDTLLSLRDMLLLQLKLFLMMSCLLTAQKSIGDDKKWERQLGPPNKMGDLPLCPKDLKSTTRKRVKKW
jgi:hypothetical protein